MAVKPTPCQGGGRGSGRGGGGREPGGGSHGGEEQQRQQQQQQPPGLRRRQPAARQPELCASLYQLVTGYSGAGALLRQLLQPVLAGVLEHEHHEYEYVSDSD